MSTRQHGPSASSQSYSDGLQRYWSIWNIKKNCKEAFCRGRASPRKIPGRKLTKQTEKERLNRGSDFENKNPGEEKSKAEEKAFFSESSQNFSKPDYIVGHNANHNNTKSKNQFLDSYKIKNVMEADINSQRKTRSSTDLQRLNRVIRTICGTRNGNRRNTPKHTVGSWYYSDTKPGWKYVKKNYRPIPSWTEAKSLNKTFAIEFSHTFEKIAYHGYISFILGSQGWFSPHKSHVT